MNRLPIKKRSQIINFLVEGMSIRTAAREAGVSINTATKLLKDVGAACNDFQSRTLYGLPCRRIECKATWALSGGREPIITPVDAGGLVNGDVYTWTARCVDTELIAFFAVSKRDADCAHDFMHEVAARLTNQVQLTAGDCKSYLNVVEDAVGDSIEHVELVKQYGSGSLGDQRSYSPQEFVGAEQCGATRNPDPLDRTINYTVVPSRLNRLISGFNKTVENLEHALSVHLMHHNFARIHKSLRVTPAMAAGISDHVWSTEEICNLVADSAAKKRAA